MFKDARKIAAFGVEHGSQYTWFLNKINAALLGIQNDNVTHPDNFGSVFNVKETSHGITLIPTDDPAFDVYIRERNHNNEPYSVAEMIIVVDSTFPNMKGKYIRDDLHYISIRVAWCSFDFIDYIRE